jgi:hypothetical protein
VPRFYRRKGDRALFHAECTEAGDEYKDLIEAGEALIDIKARPQLA